MADQAQEDWTVIMRCVMPGHIECAAKAPEACICRTLPKLQYLEAYRRIYADVWPPAPGEKADRT